MLTLLVAGASVAAQTGPDQPAPADVRPEGMSPVTQAQIALGRRVEALRQQLKVRPTLVIVNDSAAYIRAIERWTFTERFPVLIDDGTLTAHENIARFVRAFQPETVVRWSPGPDVPALPADGPARQQTITLAAARAWETDSVDALKTLWNEKGFAPPGVVVASIEDPAWPAALALAAAHGQPIIWVYTRPSDISAIMAEDLLAALDDAIVKDLDSVGYPWRQTGDAIDAVALCLNVPSRIPGNPDVSPGGGAPPNGGQHALTDRIGRHADGSRWGWCAMIPGNEAESAYRAMSALFTRPTRAWLFDGYVAGFAPPYAAARAVEVLRSAGFPFDFDGPPNGGTSDWRQRIIGGINAGLIHVNTSGHAYWFELTPGRAGSRDIPALHVPALVHFIHSFSAEVVGDRNSIAGRWLAMGAYAYVGSVHEPYLTAFFPAEVFISRLMSLVPLGAAARFDNAPTWKVNIFGDPLITVAKPVARHDEPLTLDGAVSLDDQMRASLKNGDIAGGVAALALLGRDADAMRLIRAALADRLKRPSPELAVAGFMPAFRASDGPTVVRLFNALDPRIQRDPIVIDLLWQAAPLALNAPGSDEAVATLRTRIRDSAMVDDASLLIPGIRRIFGNTGIDSMFNELIGRAKDEEVRLRLRELFR